MNHQQLLTLKLLQGSWLMANSKKTVWFYYVADKRGWMSVIIYPATSAAQSQLLK